MIGWIKSKLARTVTVTVYVDRIGDACLVDLYRVSRAGYWLDAEPPEWHGRCFQSCKQALDEHPTAVLTKVRAINIGGRYFYTGNPIDVAPKPKISAGVEG